MLHSPKLHINDILFKEGGGAVHTHVLPHRFISNKGKGILIVQFSRSTVVTEPRLCSGTHIHTRVRTHTHTEGR